MRKIKVVHALSVFTPILLAGHLLRADVNTSPNRARHMYQCRDCEAVSKAHLSDLGGSGGADGLGSDGLGTQQNSRVSLCQAVHWL